jgi:hypothetical protein
MNHAVNALQQPAHAPVPSGTHDTTNEPDEPAKSREKRVNVRVRAAYPRNDSRRASIEKFFAMLRV